MLMKKLYYALLLYTIKVINYIRKVLVKGLQYLLCHMGYHEYRHLRIITDWVDEVYCEHCEKEFTKDRYHCTLTAITPEVKAQNTARRKVTNYGYD